MGNFVFLIKSVSALGGRIKFDGTILVGSICLGNSIKFEDPMAEFVSRVDRISKGNVLLSPATVGDDVSIHLPYEVCKSLPSRSAGKLLWGTKYNKADIGREFVVDMDEFDVCPLDDARTIFYLGKMKSEGAVVKVCDENKTVQIELLQQVYVPLNMLCTFTYNGKKYEGKVTKIVK